MSWQLCRARGRVRFCACEAVFVLSNLVVANCEIRFAEVEARVTSSRKSLDLATHGAFVAAVVRFQRGNLGRYPTTLKIGRIRTATALA